jgi:hypothetical protein
MINKSSTLISSPIAYILKFAAAVPSNSFQQGDEENINDGEQTVEGLLKVSVCSFPHCFLWHIMIHVFVGM